MATVGKIYDFLDGKAPFATQLGFDNAGLLVGDPYHEVKKVLVCVDITESVVEEALQREVDLVVSHHPLIWGSLPAVTTESRTGRNVISLIQAGIAAICAHTNLDMAKEGVNAELAAVFELQDCSILKEEGRDKYDKPYGIGTVGLLAEPMDFSGFAYMVKTRLEAPSMRIMRAGERYVERVAVGGGACSSMLKDVIAANCDCFVTAEIKHDVYLEARALGIHLIDAGHYSTEAVIVRPLMNWIGEAFPHLEILRATEQEVYDSI